MRKLMHSKKGFTLVELMIVVVIMGILVAVAVPVYGAVTKNAQKKTCKSNMRIIKSNMSEYYMQGNNGNALSLADGSHILTSGTLAAGSNEFINLFDGHTLPKCPTAQSAYNISIDVDGSAVTYTVACTDTNVATDHNG